MEKKKIVVCGATGMQGGSVLRNLTQSEAFEITALTRNPDSSKAKGLFEKDIKVAKADLQDEQSLTEAFKGANGVFGVTQPFSADYKKCNPRAELEQGKFVANACLVANDVIVDNFALSA